jgi:hypothetical protein
MMIPLVYWLLLAVPAVAGAAPYKLRGGSLKVVVGVGAVALILVIGGRYIVGCDWYNYILSLDSLNYTNPLEAMQVSDDPAYGLLSWISLNLNFGITGVNFFCATIFTWGLLAFCIRQPLPWLAFVVAVPMLVVAVAMGFTRQGVAIGFLMLGFNAFTDRKLVKFLVFVALAAAFHKTAVVMAPLAVFIDPKRIASPLLVGGVATVMLVVAFLSAKFDSLTANYIDSDAWIGEGAAAVYRLGLNLLAAVVFLLLNKRWRRKYQDARLYFMLALASIAVFPFAFVEPVAADRMGLYLLPFQIGVFARVPTLFNQKTVIFALKSTAIIASALLMFVWFTFAHNSWCWIPYGNVLFN